MAKGVGRSWWWALLAVGMGGCGTGTEGLPDGTDLEADPLSGRKGKPGHDKGGGKGDDDKDKGQDKVVVCHVPPGNPANAHTIEVGAPAVQAHLGHGDSLGACKPKDHHDDDGYRPDDCECRDDHGHHHPGDCDDDDGKPDHDDDDGKPDHDDDDDGYPDDDDGKPDHDDDDDDGKPDHDDDDDDGKPDHDDGKPDAGKKDKVVVCHIPPGNPANAHTIVIGAPAVPAHLRHGDRLGACKKDHHPGGGY